MTSPGVEVEGELVVVDRQVAATDVLILTLASPQGDPLPAWRPGAHVDLGLGKDLTRQYSLCGDPADAGSWRVGVLREANGRGGSTWIHDELTVGGTLRFRGPRNHFPLEPSSKYLFVAGGIGITPILPMVAAADTAEADWTLLYGGRRRSSMAFLDELAKYGDRVLVRPEDEYGLLDLDSLLGQPRPDTLVYCCGPEPLLDATTRMCAAWPEGSLWVERFTASVATSDHSGDRPIRVELRASGISVDVAADTSILQAVVAAGIDVLSSCEDGVCGTCMTTVLDGVPEHRDSVLSAGERKVGKCMLICVSRAQGDHLVLDL